jgi:hypothetical protein
LSSITICVYLVLGSLQFVLRCLVQFVKSNACMCGSFNMWVSVCVGLKRMGMCMCGIATVRVDVMFGNCTSVTILVMCNMHLLD